MKKLTLQITFLAAVLILICMIVRLSRGNVYTSYIKIYREENAGGEMILDPSSPPIVTFGAPRKGNGYLKIDVRPAGPGRATALLNDPSGNPIYYTNYHVGRFLTVYDGSTGGFTGDTGVLAALAAFFLITSLLLLRFFIQSRGAALYTYNTLYVAGFSIFAFCTGILMLSLTIRKLMSPAEFTMYSAYSAISSASYVFMTVTFPFILVFSVLMAISNIELLRHERKRLANVLGILISVLLLTGEGIVFFLFGKEIPGSEFHLHLRTILQNLYATVFVYFECILLGVIICSIRAVRHRPDMDKDYILILGCGFRKDGTLTPLLRGRVDQAVRFWKEQKEATGKTAILIPSGGQGPDEVMSEAAAMKRYLVNECSIPEEYILTEDQSKNTFQNMLFSKKIIDQRQKDAKTIFSTTNYHVFRSGVWSNLAGLGAEGIGSHTKWWFWPNAFIRECLGLLRNRIRQELVLLLVLTAIFATISILLG